jgi:hypothetical protein
MRSQHCRRVRNQPDRLASASFEYRGGESVWRPRADYLRCDAEGACLPDGDEIVQVRRQFLKEQNEVPATGIVKKCDGRHQQRFRRGGAPNECGGRSRDFSVEEAPHATLQTERAPNRCLTQVDNGLQRDVQLKDHADDRECTKRGVLPLGEMARELREHDPLIGGDVERRITRAIPAVITNPSGKTSIKYAEWGTRGDMSNPDATPWADVRVERAQLGTPS